MAFKNPSSGTHRFLSKLTYGHLCLGQHPFEGSLVGPGGCKFSVRHFSGGHTTWAPRYPARHPTGKEGKTTKKNVCVTIVHLSFGGILQGHLFRGTQLGPWKFPKCAPPKTYGWRIPLFEATPFLVVKGNQKETPPMLVVRFQKNTICVALFHIRLLCL